MVSYLDNWHAFACPTFIKNKDQLIKMKKGKTWKFITYSYSVFYVINLSKKSTGFANK